MKPIIKQKSKKDHILFLKNVDYIEKMFKIFNI